MRKQTWYNRIFCALGWHWPKKWYLYENGNWVETWDGLDVADPNTKFRRKCDSCEQWISNK